MNYLHSTLTLSTGDVVIVTLDKQANVILLDDYNLNNYRNGNQFKYYGGLAKHSPYTISAPSNGKWNLVVEAVGGAGQIRLSVSVSR